MLKREGMVPRLLTAVALVSSFVWFYWFQKNSVGYFSETKDGVTRVMAGSSPFVVSLAILGILLFVALMTKEAHIETYQPASLLLRFVAFVFDCWILCLTVIGVSSLVHLLLEAQRSGTFRWHYEQASGADTGGADTVLILLNLTVMLMYFVIPLARRRQTAGQWLFRLATVSANGSVLYLPFSTALWRTCMEFQGLIYPWRLWRGTDTQGRTWYDRETGFMVVRY
jgi:RDD family protein